MRTQVVIQRCLDHVGRGHDKKMRHVGDYIGPGTKGERRFEDCAANWMSGGVGGLVRHVRKAKAKKKEETKQRGRGSPQGDTSGPCFSAQWALGSKVRSATPRAIKDSRTDGSRRFLLGATTVRRRSSPEIRDGCRGPLTRRLSGPGTMHGRACQLPHLALPAVAAQLQQGGSAVMSIDVSGAECCDVSAMGQGKGLSGPTCKTLAIYLDLRRRCQED